MRTHELLKEVRELQDEGVGLPDTVDQLLNLPKDVQRLYLERAV